MSNSSLVGEAARAEVDNGSPTWSLGVERVTGIEPALSAWEADVLPLNYIRLTRHFVRLRLLSHLRRASNVPQALERRNLRLAHVGRTEPEPNAPWLAATQGTLSQAGVPVQAVGAATSAGCGGRPAR